MSVENASISILNKKVSRRELFDYAAFIPAYFFMGKAGYDSIRSFAPHGRSLNALDQADVVAGDLAKTRYDIRVIRSTGTPTPDNKTALEELDGKENKLSTQHDILTQQAANQEAISKSFSNGSFRNLFLSAVTGGGRLFFSKNQTR